MLRALLLACSAATFAAAPLAAAARTFSNPTPIAIPVGGGASSPYPSDILVSGIAEPLASVTVTLREFGHTWPADVDVLLVGPGGENLILMSDVGAGIPVSGVTLVFSDAASSPLASSEITSGTWRPSNQAIVGADSFPPPAPVPSSATALAAFVGTNPNGLWSLYVVNDSAGDEGVIAGGWSLRVPEPGPAGSLAAVVVLLGVAALGRGGRPRP
jgi:hypothetical protein